MEMCEGALLAAGEKGSARAVMTFPALARLSNGTLLSSWRCGSTKDCEDESVEVCASADGGRTWNQPMTVFGETRVNGVRGSLRVVYFTEIKPAHVLAACLWIDRGTFPGKPLFNPVTEGCLPMKVLLADSFDWGTTWGPWREVEMPADIGPPSLTNPILKFSDGTLAMSIETNKNYEDPSKWMQGVTLRHSRDMGKTWNAPLTASRIPRVAFSIGTSARRLPRTGGWGHSCGSTIAPLIPISTRAAASVLTTDGHGHLPRT